MNMRNYWKYLARTAIAFSPTIGLILARYMGLVEGSIGGLDTGVAILQGIVLIPFVVWMWIDFRRYPTKYSAPSWLIRSMDLLLIGFIVVVLVLQYLVHRQ